MSRDYTGIELPYTIASWKVPYAIQMIVQAGRWSHLPYDLAVKLNDAAKHRQDLVVTKADLDSLADDDWLYLKSRLT